MCSVIIICKIVEMQIEVILNFDGIGVYDNQIGVGFFDYMLDQLLCYLLIDMMVQVKGDLYIDDYYMVEDIGIVIGQVLM